MPKGSEELTKERENEIIDACKKLYRTKSFKEITIKEIGKTTSFTRTSIYNYFQTKEEIFLALLQREYEHWNIDLRSALRKKTSMSRMDFAILLAETLSKRELMLKLLSMNMYDIEENSSIEKLIDFKQVWGIVKSDGGMCQPLHTGTVRRRRYKISLCVFPFCVWDLPLFFNNTKAKGSYGGGRSPSSLFFHL